MRRLLAFVLSAVLLVGAGNASLLTALASDNGVIGNGFQNQSLNNGLNQYIPESVVIDGNVNNDTAWANHKWNEVDTNNGIWDKEKPAESSKALTYKYQLHYDYEYFYGAVVVDALDAEITVWLNDLTNYTTDAEGNKTYGYSHKMIYTVSGGAVTGDSFVDYNGNTVTKDAPYAAQQYIKASKKDGDSVAIEFRRYLASFTSAKSEDIQYFISVKVGDDSLYFPRMRPVGELYNIVPSATVWPVAIDDANHLTHQADSDTLSPITVDGNFDEAVWAGLSDFYLSEKSNIADEKANPNKGTIDLSHVKTHGSQTLIANDDKYIAISAANAALGDTAGLAYISGGLSVNDGHENIGNGTSEGVKFKYDYRIDGEYFYIAVVAEVPKMAWTGVTVGAQDMNQTGKNEQYYVKTEPNFTIQFYNQTNDYFTAEGTPITTNKYNGWAVEHLISFEAYKLASNPNYAGAFDNITSRVVETNGAISNVNWKGTNFQYDDTCGQDTSAAATGYQGAGSYRGEYDGFGVWNFECRIKLESVLSSTNLKNNEANNEFSIEDLGFNVVVHDRRWLYNSNFGSVTNTANNKTYPLQYAYKSGDKWYYTNHYNRNAAWLGSNAEDLYDYNNLEMLTGAETEGSVIPGIVIDGNLDKRNNAAIAGADHHIDSTFRGNGYANNKMQYTYIMAADYEYLYGAAVISNYTSGGSFRVWTNVNGSAAYENAFDFSVNKDTGEVKFYSWYANGKGNVIGSTNSAQSWYRDPSTVDLDVAWKKLDSGDVRFEFRIALSEIGVKPTLTPAANQKLLSYYVSFEQGSANSGLVHPRCATVPTSAWDAAHEGRIFYNTPDSNLSGRAFDHNDSVLLDYISIDGKLDEEIWDDSGDRILVQGNNGQWTSSPARNDIFEYSYSIYIGDNFIYGAVELDDEAVPATNTNGSNYTNIEIWLANPGAFDEWGVYYNEYEFDNYYYNIYLCSDDYSGKQFAVSGPSGLVFGGSTPSVDTDCYKWNMSTANGKTYAEFMIATNSYHMENGVKQSRFVINESAGAEYYISVKHPTATGEALTLTHPLPAEMFHLTHYEDIYAEGAGIIYSDLNNDESNYNEYLDSKGRWWTHAMLVPDTASGGWKFITSKDGTRSLSADEIAKQLASDGEKYKDHYGFLPSEIAANPGCIIYCVNTGNNYIDVIEDLKVSFNNKAIEKYGTTSLTDAQRLDLMTQICAAGGGIDQYYSHETKAALQLNYASVAADLMRTTIFSWKPGDIIKIPGLVPGQDVGTQVKAMLQAQQNNQIAVELVRFVDETASIPSSQTSYSVTETSFVDPTKTVTYAAKFIEVAKPRWYESGFRNTITYTKVNENTSWGAKLPTESYWYTSNPGKLDALEHIAPEKITVDGILNDSGWNEDKWITVDEAINATHQTDSADKFVLKYQLRTDGEYLYVAAVFEGVAYNAANAPVFTLWTKDDGDDNWSKYYRVGYKTGKNWAVNAQIPARTDYHSVSTDVKYTNLESLETMSVLYNNYIDVVKNNNPSKADNTNGISLGYMDSSFYGFTDTVEESVGGRYYPDINLEVREYIFGKEGAVMKNDDNVQINGLGNYGDTSTVVEYRIALDEIDAGNNGFEYFVSAGRSGANKTEYTVHYPNVYCEPESEFNYYNLNLPFWKWYDGTAAKVTSSDLNGTMYLVNDYAPVVTLGAKFNDNFDGNGSNAIRFGGLYNETLIRRQSGDNTTDYWDVTDLGIIVAFTQQLGDEELSLSTEGIRKAEAVGIVNWKENSNFADYESFAFYVTINGIPESAGAKNLKLSARTYVCYRDLVNTDGKIHGTSAPDHYGSTIVRSINIIENAMSNESVVLP